MYRKNVSYLHKCSESFVIDMSKKNYDEIALHNISIDHFMHHNNFFLGLDYESGHKHKLQDDYFLHMQNWMIGDNRKNEQYFHDVNQCEPRI